MTPNAVRLVSMGQILAAVFFFCSASISIQSAAEQDLSEFQRGVQAYQKQDYKQAVDSFTKALAEASHSSGNGSSNSSVNGEVPKSVTLLTNLGLAQFKLGNKGYALAYLRQALSLDPGFPIAQSALTHILAQAQVKEIPHRIEAYEMIREKLLEPVNILSYFFLSALFLLTGGWILISYLGQRKRASQQELGEPPFPVIGSILLVCFVAATGLSILKLLDSTKIRGTIVEPKVAVQAAPGENQAVLFDLFEGIEVILRRKQDGWVQVSYPGGMTGWIPEKSIL